MKEVEAVLRVRIKRQFNDLYEDEYDAAVKGIVDGRIFDVNVDKILNIKNVEPEDE